jgi:hypothetical protein
MLLLCQSRHEPERVEHALAGNGIYMLVKDVPAVKSLFKKSKKTATQKTSTAPVNKSDYLVGTSLHLDQKKKDKAEAKKGK